MERHAIKRLQKSNHVPISKVGNFNVPCRLQLQDDVPLPNAAASWTSLSTAHPAWINRNVEPFQRSSHYGRKALAQRYDVLIRLSHFHPNIKAYFEGVLLAPVFVQQCQTRNNPFFSLSPDLGILPYDSTTLGPSQSACMAPCTRPLRFANAKSR